MKNWSIINFTQRCNAKDRKSWRIKWANVTKTTDYLIMGNNDYCPLIKDGKSSKQKKAEAMRARGYDISIITENTFTDLIEDNNA